MNDIAEAAGVTKPVLYQHFGSKRDLYREVLEDVGGRLEETIAKAAAGAPGPREQVEAGFGAYFRFVAQEQDAFQVLFGGDTRRDPQCDSYYVRCRERNFGRTSVVTDRCLVSVCQTPNGRTTWPGNGSLCQACLP